MKTKEINLLLQFIKPLRNVPPYSGIKNSEKQAVAIVYDLTHIKALDTAVKIYIKNGSK